MSRGREVVGHGDWNESNCLNIDVPLLEVAVTVPSRRIEKRFVGTLAAAEYSGIPAGTLRAWRCQGVGPKFYKPRGRALYDIADLDEFIRSGIRVSSVRASKEERNVYLPTG